MDKDTFVPLRNDYMFKAVMQKSPNVLKNLIAVMLEIPVEAITKCQLMNPIVIGEVIDEKTIILDVRVEINEKEIIDIEMQNYYDKFWTERSVFYGIKNSVFLEAGENYDKIKPVYLLGFLNFTPIKENPYFYSEYALLDVRSHWQYSKLLSIRIVDMTKIAVARNNDHERQIARWASMFMADSRQELDRLSEGDDVMEEMIMTYAVLSEEEKVRQQCLAREDYYRRQAGMHAQGIEEGISAINRLNEALAKVGRVDDIIKAASDMEYQKQLMKEFDVQ